MIDFKNYIGGLDNPDPRDYKAEELFGAIPLTAKLPKAVTLDFTKPLNQGQRGACTVFGSSGALFETSAQRIVNNGLEFTQAYDPWIVWDKALTLGASDTQGWYVQSALQLIKDMKFASAYIQVGASGQADAYTLKYWMSQGKCIVGGSAHGDWGKIVQTGVYSSQTSFAGHCWMLSAYNDDHIFPDGTKGGFYCPNSWGGVGAFWIKYSDISVFYTHYYLVGTEDIEEMKKIQKAKEIQADKFSQAAKDKGIWNGDRPNDIATEIEISIMARRTQKADKKLSRQAWADIIQAQILRGKADFKFWSGTEGTKIATDKEIALMFTRAIKKDASINSLVLTRKKIAEVIGRDF